MDGNCDNNWRGLYSGSQQPNYKISQALSDISNIQRNQNSNNQQPKPIENTNTSKYFPYYYLNFLYIHNFLLIKLVKGLIF